ncbi:hypothetical protein ColTof3_10561 [Colletotrichum tofieldiae]|nr:hypothetical protein ColTof3_10561 [Colletotrichum tofieldiae]
MSLSPAGATVEQMNMLGFDKVAYSRLEEVTLDSSFCANNDENGFKMREKYIGWYSEEGSSTPQDITDGEEPRYPI